MKKTVIILVIILVNALHCNVFGQKEETAFNVSIPSAGNSWIMSNNEYTSSDILTSDGIIGWDNQDETIRVFFHIDRPSEISLGIRSKVSSLNSEIGVIFIGRSKTIKLSDTEFKDVNVGIFTIKEAGYHYVDIKGLNREGDSFADISSILLQIETPKAIKYVKDDFYFGRRGPSDHLNFEIPDDVENVEWFYSELLIPENQDVEGSYFMANGFAEGYFGIQVNSPTERRILFSVWSPYKTDNPDEVPEEFRIKLLKKGKNVTTNQFGNEGSGGQSFKVFNWKANTKYGFLIGANPSDEGFTDYVAYFFDPEMNDWSLIAQFRRPKTTTYLKRLYSFLENFIPDQGATDRRGLYQNQWVYNSSGWHEINKAVFTADNTARKGYRLDYSGGNESTGFYLKNCGFTNDNTSIGTIFQRNKLGIEPKINFKSLE